ncbi:MAG TPA: hypothetical protein DEH25_08925 [Chloroflexi bacterium]|nr:hypothetical protein [Chloroflexota bacterium]
MQDLVEHGCARETRQPYQEQDDFAQGVTLFATGSSAGLPFYQRAVADSADFDWLIAALPLSTPDPVMLLSGTSFSLPAGAPETQLAAWLFIKYFTSPEIQAQWAQTSGYFPVRAGAAPYLTDHLAANSAYAAAWDLLPFGVAEPSTPGYDDVRKMVAEAFGAILAGERPAPILNQLNQDANFNLAEQLAR